LQKRPKQQLSFNKKSSTRLSPINITTSYKQCNSMVPAVNVKGLIVLAQRKYPAKDASV